ncbi:MAG: hypothetical protein P8166_11315 [Candidatus Thiodiazotropha sp.]
MQIITALLFATQIQAAGGDSNAKEWQQRRLLQPSEEELRLEQAGRAMIYQGLTGRQLTGDYIVEDDGCD